jgi:hypothetical protein
MMQLLLSTVQTSRFAHETSRLLHERQVSLRGGSWKAYLRQQHPQSEDRSLIRRSTRCASPQPAASWMTPCTPENQQKCVKEERYSVVRASDQFRCLRRRCPPRIWLHSRARRRKSLTGRNSLKLQQMSACFCFILPSCEPDIVVINCNTHPTNRAARAKSELEEFAESSREVEREQEQEIERVRIFADFALPSF